VKSIWRERTLPLNQRIDSRLNARSFCLTANGTSKPLDSLDRYSGTVFTAIEPNEWAIKNAR